MSAPDGVEVAWLGGRCVAMLHDLPDGTWFTWSTDSSRLRSDIERNGRPNCPVVVVAWPDGTAPVPPADDDGCDCGGYADGHWADCSIGRAP